MGDGVLEFAGVCSWIDKMTKLSEVKASVVSDPLWPHGLYSPWNSSGLNTGVGSLSLLQGIFSPRDWTQVSHIAGGFFTSWVTSVLATQSGLTLCDPMDCSPLGSSVHGIV